MAASSAGKTARIVGSTTNNSWSRSRSMERWGPLKWLLQQEKTKPSTVRMAQRQLELPVEVLLNPRSRYKRAYNMGYCIESQDLAQPPRLQGLT
jgi:hypothetical protein